MLFRFALAFLLLAPLSSLWGQEPKKTKEEGFLWDLVRTGRFMRGRPMKPRVTPDSQAVLFLRSGARSFKLGLFEFEIGSGKTRCLLTPEDVLKGAEEKLSPEEKAIRERMRVSAGGFTSFQLSPDGERILLALAGRLYVVERKTTAITELKTGPGPLLDPKFSPDQRFVSYVRDHDVHLYELAKAKEFALTNGGSAEASHGLAEFVAQEEMDRFSGYWWGPDGKELAFQESDARAVETWFVADPFQPGGTPTPFFYPRPGKNNVKVKLAIARVPGGETTWVEWDREKYPYLATVRWETKGPLLLVVQTRDQKELVLLRADSKTGKTTPLLTETDPAWVNLHQEVPVWLTKKDSFLWVSEREEGKQLEIRNSKGRLSRVLVTADQGYQGLIGVDEEKGLVYFRASSDPTQSHIHRVGLGPLEEVEPVTEEKGHHGGVLSPKGDVLVLTSQLWKKDEPKDFMPQTHVLQPQTGKRLGTLPSVAEDPSLVPQVELLQVGSKEYFAAITLPWGFDFRKKYPVLVDVYGGPHHLHVAANKARWLLNQWNADQGFIVIAIDGRGTPGRGRHWERAIFQKFSSLPLEDQIEGLLNLSKRYPPMDLERVGISGWSFGGYMGALAVLSRPDVFHAGVAGAPVTDWLDYDTHYTERYLGVPPGADKAYRDNSLLPLAKNLSRPLLLLHGTADDNVYFRHSLQLADALMRHGKDFEMVPLGGATHRVSDAEAWVQMQLRMVRFLKKHLGEPR